MHIFYKFLFTAFSVWLFTVPATAQVSRDTSRPTSIDVNLENLFTQKVPKKYKVAGITVTGNKYFDQALLISVANINVGDEVTIPGGDQFAKAIINLWKQNYFSDVEIYVTRLQGQDIFLEIAVTERPRLGAFDFKGIRKSEAEELSGKVGLVRGRIINENNRRSSVEAISKYYNEKGFRGVKTQILETKDPKVENSTNITFVIDKGNKVKINEVNFVGNTIPDQRLENKMKGTKEMTRLTLNPRVENGGYAAPDKLSFNDYVKQNGFLSYSKTRDLLDPYIRLKLLTSAKFNEKKYEEDKEKIIDYYNSLGFRDAVIAADTQYYNTEGNLNIDLKIDEGRKYYFGNIVWRGNTKYSDSVLAVILGIQKGDIYNVETLNKKLGKEMSPEGGDISGLYMDDGYLFFRTEPIETAVYNDTIDHEIRVIEGPQATIKNVRIAGNDKTKEHVIRRELRTIPGEKFSRADLIRSNREIANLGYFNQEKIGINPIPNAEDGTVDINYTVEEKSSDQLELSAGFGGGIGLTGTLGVSFNNFSIRNIWKKSAWDPLPTGDGQKLSLRVQSNGKAFRSYNFSFTEPWLGGKKRNSFSVSIYDTKFRNAQFGPNGLPSFDPNGSYIQTTGLGVSLGKQLKWPDDFFSFVTSLNYTRYKLKDYQIFEGFSNGFSNNFNIKLALQRSSVNQPIFPSGGSSFLLSSQFTPPYSLIDKDRVNSANPYQLVEYHKWRFNGEWYVPIGKPHGAERNKQFVLKTAVKLGYIGRYNDQLEVSPFERFQVGDAGLSNNFALLGYDIIAHRGYPVYNNSNPKVNPDQQSTQRFFTMFNKYTVEMRYPLSLNPSSTIFGLGFFEAANGWYSTKEYNPFRLRRSVGLGMRFYLPMFGLLGFDYGIGLDRYAPNSRLKDAARFTFMLGFEPE
jgi:outer membrane protein insertion porin family